MCALLFCVFMCVALPAGHKRKQAAAGPVLSVGGGEGRVRDRGSVRAEGTLLPNHGVSHVLTICVCW